MYSCEYISASMQRVHYKDEQMRFSLTVIRDHLFSMSFKGLALRVNLVLAGPAVFGDMAVDFFAIKAFNDRRFRLTIEAFRNDA
jgi:hypothetical protein